MNPRLNLPPTRAANTATSAAATATSISGATGSVEATKRNDFEAAKCATDLPSGREGGKLKSRYSRPNFGSKLRKRLHPLEPLGECGASRSAGGCECPCDSSAYRNIGKR
jgi:hypothetical protein